MSRSEGDGTERLLGGAGVARLFEALPVDVAGRLAAVWGRPCEGLFEELLSLDAGYLARVVGGGLLAPPDLSLAAEILGRSSDSNVVRTVLTPLLDAESALVREGAIYGLAPHLDGAVRDRLEEVGRADPSPAVRAVALEALT